MMQMMCQHPACAFNAEQEVKAEGTTYSFMVCRTDVFWAKEQIQRDLPGRRVVTKSLRGF
ncbi:hypothetical protein AB0I90_03290 [Micromonospora wenchangensis]|uniref:hypothetical protein n=1 Tax=Micromonospora TaxID=1873 RepID=UPI00188EEAFF|nr:hypothetical protein [Micromonospora sp. S-DT3-3-22]